jgi:hypothetical protein
MKTLLAIAALILFQTGFAQDRSDTNIKTAVIVHKDPRVDVLVKKQAASNASIKKASSRTAKGFRLMVVNTSKRDEAIAAKTKLYSYYPELKSYLVYQSPFFKVKVGNFKTRPEAEKYRKQMNTLFPKGVFIVNDVIEVKPED